MVNPVCYIQKNDTIDFYRHGGNVLFMCSPSDIQGHCLKLSSSQIDLRFDSQIDMKFSSSQIDMKFLVLKSILKLTFK